MLPPHSWLQEPAAPQQRRPRQAAARLLSAADERELAAAIARGRQLEAAAAAWSARTGGAAPTTAQLAAEAGLAGGAAEVAAVRREAAAAAQQLVDANHGLVLHLASRLRNAGLAFEVRNKAPPVRPIFPPLLVVSFASLLTFPVEGRGLLGTCGREGFAASARLV